MKKIFFILFFVFLAGCRATITSDAISNASVSQLNAISNAIKEVSSGAVAKCPEVSSKLDLINSQISGVKGQIENITLACRTEKKVLEEKITVRNIIIGFLSVIIGLILFIVFRSKIKPL